MASYGWCTVHLQVPQFVHATTTDSEWGDVCDQCAQEIVEARRTGEWIDGCDVRGMPIDRNHPWNKG